MKINTVFLATLGVLALAGSAFADFSSAMNVYVKSGMDGKIHISQSELAQSCSAVSGCQSGSFTNASEANAWLVQTLSNYWADGKTLVFDSDIDFGGFDATTPEGECDAQLLSLPYPAGGSVEGNGKSVKNLCYVYDVASGAMVEPVGLFSQNDGVASVSDLTIENVRIVVNDSRDAADKDLYKDGKLFYPVGALFGYLKNGSVEKLTLKNVYIKAPFAGGVAGFASQSSFSEILATENLKIENDIDLSAGSSVNSGKGVSVSNYAGSAMVENYQSVVFPSEYSVFLGGLVGVVKNGTFYKAGVNAKIADLSGLSTRSALGGLVGLVYAEDEDFVYRENALAVTIDGSGNPSFTEISGGRAMGGFFGEIISLHKSASGYVGSKFEIVESWADSVKIAKAGSDSVFAGGFVGTFKSVDNGRMAIEKSAAHVDIEDEVKTEESFNYYAGGFIGATNTCGISYDMQNVSGYVSITQSNVSGHVRVESSSKSVPDAHVNAFLGGMGGFVCFTADGTALKNDTSNVVVESYVNTTSDSIFVGGFVGVADVYNYNVVLNVSDLIFGGEVDAQMAQDKVNLGGIFGAFLQNQGPQVAFENVYVKNENSPIAKVMSNGMSKKSAVAHVGGLCGNCRRVAKIALASVIGDIVSDDENFAGDSLLVGGLVGRSESTQEVLVTNTFSVGNVSVKDAGKAKMGYLFGFASFVSNENREISRNYHYSENDGIDAFGFISNGSDITSTWKNLPVDKNKNDVFLRNVRNGSVTSLSDNGQNGTKTSAEMQKSDFAAFLNDGLEDDVWNFDSDLNNGYPFFGTTMPTPGDPETYTVTFMNGTVELLSMEVEEGVVPQYVGEEPKKASTAKYSYTFDGWTPTPVAATQDAVYKAVFDSTLNEFKVVFISHEGDTLSKQTVAYGNAAIAPNDVKCDKHVFSHWDKSFESVTENLVVTAIATDIPKSSSSYSSSSVSSSSVSSSSQVSSSSEEPPSSSSVSSSSYSSSSLSSSSQNSSSSEKPKSSSSRGGNGKKKLEIAKADIEYSGKNAIRFNYVANVSGTGENTTARIQIVGDDGVYLDTLLFDSLVTDVAKGDWQLAPAPIGSYEVILTLKNAKDSVKTKNKFNVDGRIVVEPRSWQMVSLAAIDKSSLMKDDNSAVYWWDETNPIGDYWQYRVFDKKETPDATQGFWYGTGSRDTLVLKAETPTKDSKVVWELENRYSGWNMIANPHGWQIDLEKGKGGKVTFWRWNAETGEYEIPTTLGPYEAVWAQVEKPTTWEVSSRPVFEIKPADTKPLAKAGEMSGWSLRAVLSDDFGKRDSWNFLGVGDASANIKEPPAGMGDHVTLSIVEGKTYLAKSLKAKSGEYNWNLEASASSNRNARLSFEGARELASQGFGLYVTVNGRTQKVEGEDSVELSLGSKPVMLSVRVAKEVKVVKNDKLEGLHAVNNDGHLFVNFVADKSLAGGLARVELVSLKGQVIASTLARTLAGANSMSFMTPKSGVYLLRVKVGNHSAVGRILVK